MVALRTLCLLLVTTLPAVATAGAVGSTGGVTPATEAGDEDLFAEEDVVEVADPVEGVNRVLFAFNDRLYFWLLKPVARGWRVVPEGVRISVANFFSNLTAPARVVNDTLQGKIGQAGNEIMRFVINSTAGGLGLFDVARHDPVLARKPAEDFGQTLGRYGVGSGPYLVLPVLGPSNVRDAVGWGVDFFLDPFTYLTDGIVHYGVKSGDVVNDTSLDRDTYEAIKRDSLDPYLTIRDAYDQHRRGAIKQ